MRAPRRGTRAAHLHAGVTLIELVVVVAILGIAAGVAGVAFHSQHLTVRETDPAAARVAEARREAIASGRGVSFEIPVNGATALATAYPDGRVVADSALHVDELTGEVLDGPH